MQMTTVRQFKAENKKKNVLQQTAQYVWDIRQILQVLKMYTYLWAVNYFT